MFASYVMLALSFALSIDVSTKVLAIKTEDFTIFFLSFLKLIQRYPSMTIFHCLCIASDRMLQETACPRHG